MSIEYSSPTPINPIPTNPHKVIIFDFDGVLADTQEAMLGFASLVCSRLGYPCQPSIQDLHALERMSFATLGIQLGIPQDRIPEYTRQMLHLFATSPTPCPLFPGMDSTMRRAANGNLVAVISGNDTQVILDFLAYHNLLEYANIVLGIDIPGSKQEKIISILETFQLRGLPAYMIGDAASDIEAAHASGITSIAVSWGHQQRSRLEAAQPNLLVDTPQELIEVLGI